MKRIHLRFYIFCILFFSGLNPFTQGFSQEAKPVEPELRGLWVTRWDYSSPGDIARIFASARDHYLNTIFFQIRGAGSVYFRSQIEPMAWVNSPADTIWDPLSSAIYYAHEMGLQLHAWMNVYPGCNGNHSSTHPPYLYRTHRDWFVVDEGGTPQAQQNHYRWLSPTHPQVQAHLLALARELVENYAIDGLHLDYIRYPGPGYSFDSESIISFLQKNGHDPNGFPEDWDAFRRDAITELLSQFYSLTHEESRNIALSCAVVRNFQLGNFLYFQDVETWVNRGIVDFLVPMIYTPNMTLFRRIVKSYSNISGNVPFYPGLIVANNFSLVEQVFYSRQIGLAGHCFFAWEDFLNNGQNSKAGIFKKHVYAEPTPKIVWKENIVSDLKIESIEWLPKQPTANEAISVTCEISCPDSTTLKDIQPVLLWNNQPFTNGFQKQIFFFPNSPSWKTAAPIPGQEENPEIYFQIKIVSNEAADSVLATSSVQRIQIMPKNSPYRFVDRWGPLLENAEFAAVDFLKRIWVCERGKSQVRIFEPNGREASLSPIRGIKSRTNNSVPLSNLTGIACDPDGSVWLAFYSGKGLLAKLNSLTGKTELLKQVPFFPGQVDADSSGNIFVIEQDGPNWHVFDPYMNELPGSPIFGSHLSQGIAVSPDGNRVYVTCQAEGTVHCWEGSVANQRADYRQIDDLPLSGAALGQVETDDSGRVFISLQEKQTVAMFDPKLKTVSYLTDPNAPKRIIKGIAIEPGGRRVYFVEWGVMSPMRLQKWIRID